MHLQRLSNGEHGPENLRRYPCFLHSVCVKFARKQNGCLLSADILRRTPMLCGLWILLSMVCRSGGNAAKYHQDAPSDPREIHRRAPASYDFLEGNLLISVIIFFLIESLIFPFLDSFPSLS